MTSGVPATLRRLLQTVAFCLVVAALLQAFQPGRPYARDLVYSLAIGGITWAVIDLGRRLIPSSAHTGWPEGAAGPALVVAGIAFGYLLGTALAERILMHFGLMAGSAGDASGAWRVPLLVSVMAGLAGTFYFYSRNRGTWLERRMTEAQRHADEARLKLLETQLEPHMLFNTLANLRVLIAVDPPRAQQMLDHMIAYLRATLDGSRATTHALQLEFDRLRDYLALMAIRMGPRLAYTLDLPPALAAHPVPALLLQPLVENSIQHGLEPRVEGGSVTVTARRDDDDLVLEVTDTGAATASPTGGGSGFGLAQVRERLARLYGSRASLDFVATPGQGARAVLRLPLAS